MHGDLKPGNVMVTSDRAIILDFGFAQERARLSARRPGAPPDGGTPNYMAPERLRSGGASAEDDMYALGLTLWEMWTCRVPEPGYRPRAKPMRSQIMFDVPSALSVDEVKQIFRCLTDDPSAAPARAAPALLQPDLAHDEPGADPARAPRPGPPLGRGASEHFAPGAQSLLVTFATNAPDAAGSCSRSDKPLITIGRRAGQDIVMPEATVSGAHAVLQAGSRAPGRSRTPAARTAPTPTTATSANRTSRCCTAARSSSASRASSS